MKKVKSKKGFTLAELLLVIGIISILVAIAIPAFSAQLEKARVTVDQSNARAASSLAYSEYMLYHVSSDGVAGGPVTYTFGTDPAGNLLILSHSGKGGDAFEDNAPDGAASEIQAKSASLGETKLSVTVDDGKVTENTWLSALNG